jgi:hypothetical protein
MHAFIGRRLQYSYIDNTLMKSNYKMFISPALYFFVKSSVSSYGDTD